MFEVCTTTSPPFPGFTIAGMWPCRRGAVEKHLVKFDKPPARKDVNAWLATLEKHPAVQSLPAHGRAVLAIYAGLGRLMNWKSGRLEAAYKTIGFFSRRYSRSTVGEYLKFLCDHGIITKVPRYEERRVAGGRFLKQQVTNVYAFRPPSEWKLAGAIPLDIPPPPLGTLGYPEPVLTALELGARLMKEGRDEDGIEALEQGDLLDRTLARLGRSIAARTKDPPD
ncbi:hypothetical protein HEQ69_11440 [Haematospirillum jordaniae]|uniref:hypothetical protein n=1 Tax=Haematospirillum jordaniae TaxID=1549855 RepID=UPI001432F077|nr:hypothetical protein [Haematospirillum jordaniae]NKD46313.1 hypothetical protein [Haematospirillum jordaniae]